MSASDVSSIPFPDSETPNKLEFTVTEEGTYHGQCAEFCGVGHATMFITVKVVSAAQWRLYAGGLK